MTSDLKTEPSLGLTQLVTGIIEDAQLLITQQLTLFQGEIRQDLSRTKNAVLPLLAGAAVCLLAGFFLCTMVARGLTYYWPALPEFASYGIVGVVLAIFGTILVIAGKNRFDSFDPIPDKSVNALKENIQWKTKN